MYIIAVKKSSYERANTLLRSAKFTTTSNFFSSYVCGTVYLEFDSSFDLSLASSTLCAAGILHRVSII